jgi:hypothetical protein
MSRNFVLVPPSAASELRCGANYIVGAALRGRPSLAQLSSVEIAFIPLLGVPTEGRPYNCDVRINLRRASQLASASSEVFSNREGEITLWIH